jgi:hypothetical protein
MVNKEKPKKIASKQVKNKSNHAEFSSSGPKNQ